MATRGPNTGGMGVYSPVPIVTDEEMAAMVAIMEKAAAATAVAPFTSDYRGTLYGGFMLTPEGPKIVEFNVRFGDPETQVVLPRLESDLVEVMLAVAEGRPEDVQLEPGPTTGLFPWCLPARGTRALTRRARSFWVLKRPRSCPA